MDIPLPYAKPFEKYRLLAQTPRRPMHALLGTPPACKPPILGNSKPMFSTRSNDSTLPTADLYELLRFLHHTKNIYFSFSTELVIREPLAL